MARGLKGIKKPHPLGSVATRSGLSQLTVVPAASSATASGSGVKISELPAADVANDTDQLEVNQSGTSRRVTVGQIATVVSQVSDLYVVTSYGIVGDGVSDNAAPLQALIDGVTATGGGTLYFPPGQYRLNSQILLKDKVYLQGAGPGLTTLDFSQKGYFSTTDGVILSAGSASNQVTVTSTVLSGAVAIPVSSIAGYAPNDWIQIRSTEVLWTEATPGEIAHVQWADSGFIYVKHPLAFDYSTAAGTVTVVKLAPVRGGVSDLKLLGAGINPAGLPVPTYTGTPSEVLPGDSRGDQGIEVRFGINWNITNVEFVGIENAAIRLFSCIGSRITANRIYFDSINQLSQYGVSLFASMLDTVISGNFFYNGRHHITTNSTSSVTQDYWRGMAVDTVIDGNTHTGAWVFPIDTHQAGSHVVISNNVVASLGGGIHTRSPNTVIQGNTIRLPTSAVPGVTTVNGIDSHSANKNLVIKGNTIIGGTGVGIFVTTPRTVGENIVISGNNIQQTAIECIYVSAANGVAVTDNVCGPVSGAPTSLIRLQDVDGGTVTGNVVTVTAASGVQYGIYCGATNLGDGSNLSIASNVVLKRGGVGTCTGIGFDGKVVNSLVGYNELSSCDVDLFTSAETSNAFLQIGYGGIILVAAGVVTIPPGVAMFSVDTEGGTATDDLDTINGGRDGQVLTIKGTTAARVVTLRDGTGNLRLASNFALTSADSTVTLIKLTTIGWYEMARSIN